MSKGDLLSWLRLTHAPYAIAALVMVVLVRRTRRVLELVAEELRARAPSDDS